MRSQGATLSLMPTGADLAAITTPVAFQDPTSGVLAWQAQPATVVQTFRYRIADNDAWDTARRRVRRCRDPGGGHERPRCRCLPVRASMGDDGRRCDLCARPGHLHDRRYGPGCVTWHRWVRRTSRASVSAAARSAARRSRASTGTRLFSTRPATRRACRSRSATASRAPRHGARSPPAPPARSSAPASPRSPRVATSSASPTATAARPMRSAPAR